MQYSNTYIETCLENRDSVFSGLSQKEKELVDQHHQICTFRKGEEIIREGDKTRGLYYIVSGKVKIFKMGIGGREQIVKMVRSNNILGYRSLFTDSTHPVSASAIEETTTCFIEKGAAIKIIKKNSDLSYALLRLLTDDLEFTVNRTLSLTQKHIRGRLAESLLVLRDTYGMEKDGSTIRVSLSREDIANLSNMTTSNAIRTLSGMVNDNIIEIEGRRIRIKDQCELERISSLG